MLTAATARSKMDPVKRHLNITWSDTDNFLS